MAFERPVTPLFHVQRVEKPWGHEILWAWSERYVGKLLHVRLGASLSLQYHETKDETLSVLHGRVRLELGEDGGDLAEHVLLPGDCVHVAAGMRHRLTALEEADLLEASTPELADVVRLSDRYGRAGTTAP